MRLEKNSPCKVNLLLNILGKRPDGFHELETILHPVNICDRLTFERCGDAVELSCSDAALPVDSRNLVHRAGHRVFASGQDYRRCSCSSGEKIPLAAGLGGGSGNPPQRCLRSMSSSTGRWLRKSCMNSPWYSVRMFHFSCKTSLPAWPKPNIFPPHTPACSLFVQLRHAILRRGEGPRSPRARRKIQPLEDFSGVAWQGVFADSSRFWHFDRVGLPAIARFPDALNGRRDRAQKLISALQSWQF